MDKINGIAIIGPPGSGKSVIGRVAVESFDNMVYISSGDIARSIASTDELTRYNISHGKMAPEDIMRDALYQALCEINKSGMEFMLDGCPRNLDQLEWLLSLFPNTRFYVVKAHDVDCITRMLERDRDDDTRETIKRRIDYYNQYTAPIINVIDFTLIPNSQSLYDAVAIMEYNIRRQIYETESKQVRQI